jgi:MSHA biogenesis protein MshI
LAVGSRQGERVRVEARMDPLAQPADAGRILAEQVRALGLTDTACNLVLGPELYSVALVERPQVPDDELKAAMRWRLQDTLEFPPDQAVLDVFPLPESASRERRMVFVVALHQESLKRVLERVHGAGIDVHCVDVSELSLRNVACTLYPEPDWSVGLLRLTAGSGVINISRGEELFLSRRVSGIPAELSEVAWDDFNDRLLLQVQRSIDYYESAMGQPPCKALLVAAAEGWQAKVCDYLSEMLPLSVRPVCDELGAVFDVRLHGQDVRDVDWAHTTGDQELLTAALPLLGGVMRGLLELDDVEAAA